MEIKNLSRKGRGRKKVKEWGERKKKRKGGRYLSLT